MLANWGQRSTLGVFLFGSHLSQELNDSARLAGQEAPRNPSVSTSPRFFCGCWGAKSGPQAYTASALLFSSHIIESSHDQTPSSKLREKYKQTSVYEGGAIHCWKRKRNYQENHRKLNPGTQISLKPLLLCYVSERRWCLQGEMRVSVGHAMGCQRLGIGLYSIASLKAALLAFKKDRIAWIRRLRYHQLTPQSHVRMLNSFRKYSEWLHFHLLLRQVCENNLLQSNLFINFPLIFFKTHTEDRCLGKSHQKKLDGWTGQLFKKVPLALSAGAIHHL